MKLKSLQLGATEVLTRTQLKNVLGGEDEIGDEFDTGGCFAINGYCFNKNECICRWYGGYINGQCAPDGRCHSTN